MHSPNDVAPTGARTFYVTNDHGYTTELGRMMEEYLQFAKSFILYYDGKAFKRVAEGLAYANGVALSPDRGRVYAAATVGQEYSGVRPRKGDRESDPPACHRFRDRTR